jgi:hypothetical protein
VSTNVYGDKGNKIATIASFSFVDFLELVTTGKWWFYRMFHLKSKPNDYTQTPSRTKRLILAAVSRCCSWCTAWNRHGRNFSCFVARWALVTDKHFLRCEILLPVCVLLSSSVLPSQDIIVKCFTNSSKRFRCEIMFENEHTLCSWIHHVRTYTAFAQLAWAAA